MIYSNEILKLIENIKKYRPQKVILFGSYARGDTNEASDIDVIIIKDTTDKFSKRIDDVLDICNNNKLEPLVYTNAEINEMLVNQNDFIRTVINEGVVIYEQQPK